MTTIKELQNSLKEFDQQARTVDTPADFAKLWKRIFDQEMSSSSAKSFSQYYKEMRSKSSTRRSSKHRKTQRRRRATVGGGGAPLAYNTTPGALLPTFGNFPSEAGLLELDQYINDSLLTSPKGFWPTPSAGIQSNKVGGGRKRKTYRKRRNSRRKQRGGNLAESLNMRGFPIPFAASPYPNFAQSAANSWAGGTSAVPTNSSPVAYNWEYKSGGPAGVIDPGQVTHIGSDFNKLASPSPWQTTN